MDDLERDLAARLRASGAEIAPAEDLPSRIRARVAQRSRRRRLLQTAVPAACLLAGAASVVELAGPSPNRPSGSASAASSVSPSASSHRGAGSSPTTSATATGPALPSAGTQPGSAALGRVTPSAARLPVDLAGARITVPPGSVVSSGGCPDAAAPVTVFLRGPHAGPNVYSCPSEPVGLSTVTFGLLAPGQSTSGLEATYVHGIRVFENPGPPGSSGPVLVPSLGVQLDASGPLSSTVVSTLSRSPRATALAGGRRPEAPRGWHLVTFGGLRLAVPPSWAVHRTVFAGPLPCQARAPSALPGLLSAPPSVTLDAGTLAPAVACPNQPAPSAPGVGPQVTAQPAASQPVSGPTDGLLIDPGPVGPLNPSASYSPCLSIHGLRACVDEDYPYGELVLRVERPHGRSVAVVVGLGGNGRTARAVLFSLRPA